MKYSTEAIPPPSLAKLKPMQKYFGIELPADYLAFLKENNGGIPLNRCFDTSNNTKVITRFMPVMDDTNSDPIGCYEVEVVWSQIFDRMGNDPDEVGSRMLPIVELEFGDKVCFDFRKYPDAPEVVVWDHERSRPNEPPHVEVVAKSFTEFLGLLKPLKPYSPPQ